MAPPSGRPRRGLAPGRVQSGRRWRGEGRRRCARSPPHSCPALASAPSFPAPLARRKVRQSPGAFPRPRASRGRERAAARIGAPAFWPPAAAPRPARAPVARVGTPSTPAHGRRLTGARRLTPRAAIAAMLAAAALRRASRSLGRAALAPRPRPTLLPLAAARALSAAPPPPTPVPLRKLKDSFLDGTSSTYIEELEERYRADPASVDKSWAGFFRALEAGAPADAVADAYHAYDTGASPTPPLTAAALSSQTIHESMKLLLMVGEGRRRLEVSFLVCRPAPTPFPSLSPHLSPGAGLPGQRPLHGRARPPRPRRPRGNRAAGARPRHVRLHGRGPGPVREEEGVGWGERGERVARKKEEKLPRSTPS